jgi:hypothetical protein
MLAYRALDYFAKESEYADRIDREKILEILGITKEEAENYPDTEQEFQNLVAEKHCSLEQMRVRLGNHMWVPQKSLESYPDSTNVHRVQVYQDFGQGYREEDSYFVQDAYWSEKDVTCDIKVGSDVKMLRIDPALCSCILKVRKLTFNGKEIAWSRKKDFLINGRILKPAKEEPGLTMVFSTDDPNININLEQYEKNSENVVHAEFEMIRVPDYVAKDLENGAARYIRY